MLAARARELAARQSVFPNTTEAGLYTPLSQTVAVPLYDSVRLDQARNTPSFLLTANDFFATAVHEITHWLDHTSTLWGQNLLIEIHQAIAAYHAQEEGAFWRIAALDSRMRREDLANYYTKIDQPNLPPGNAQTWIWKLSCGLEFGADGKPRDDRPIVFVSFYDTQRKRIARIPITIASLLETSAMWSEHVVHREILSTLPPELGHRYAQSVGAIQHEELYLPELTLYSVTAHFAASVLRITDPFVAYGVTAALTSLILNLPPACISELNVDDELRREFKDRVDALVALADPGLAFVVLCRCADRIADSVDVEPWLEDACHKAGLPPLSEIRGEAERIMSNPAVTAVSGRLADRLGTLLQIGRENMRVRGLCPGRSPSVAILSNRGELTIPPVILRDDRIVTFSPKTIEDPLLAPEPSLDLATAYANWTSEFLAACRY